MEMRISLSPDLKARIEREAIARGMSPSDFVRESLERATAQKTPGDPLFTDTAVYCDDGSVDLALNHDDYLYEDGS